MHRKVGECAILVFSEMEKAAIFTFENQLENPGYAGCAGYKFYLWWKTTFILEFMYGNGAKGSGDIPLLRMALQRRAATQFYGKWNSSPYCYTLGTSRYRRARCVMESPAPSRIAPSLINNGSFSRELHVLVAHERCNIPVKPTLASLALID